MTTKGKITATGITTEFAAGRQVRVRLIEGPDGLVPTARKTGVKTVEVTEYRTRHVPTGRGARGSARQYRFLTSAGWTGWVAPAQTFVLPPEDEAEEFERGGSGHESSDPEQTMPEGWNERLASATGLPVIKARRVPAPVTRERLFLSPVERPEQEPQRVTDLHLQQLLFMLDGGTVFELHPDGLWRDRTGAGPMLDTVALRDTVNAAKALGLARQVGGQGRYVARPILIPAPVHLGIATATRTYPACGLQAHHQGPTRIRLTYSAQHTTCRACLDYLAKLRHEAAHLAARIEARGIVTDREVTIHRGTRRFRVAEIEEDMVRLEPVLTQEDRGAIEAAGGKVRESQWVSWDLLHAVPRLFREDRGFCSTCGAKGASEVTRGCRECEAWARHIRDA